jgi:hypothetical protein
MRLVGEEVQLRGDTIVDSNPVAIAASSKESLSQMMDATLAIAASSKDTRQRYVNAFFDVVRAEQGTLLPEGTRVRILENDSIGNSRVVRLEILEGELVGHSVWTHQFFIP